MTPPEALIAHLDTHPATTNTTAARTVGLPVSHLYTRLATDPAYRDRWNRARTRHNPRPERNP